MADAIIRTDLDDLDYMPKQNGRLHNSRIVRQMVLVVLLVVVLGVTIGNLVGRNNKGVKEPVPATSASSLSNKTGIEQVPQVFSRPGEIVSGTTSSGMAYLRCASDHIVENNNLKEIVLLHGTSFTKETWESHDMLRTFCDGAKIVVALDFPINTNYQGLIEVLDSLQSSSRNNGEQPLVSGPVTLVTPSASGFSIVSWIMSNTNIAEIPHYVSLWVPVATGSLVSASDDQIAALQSLAPDFRILAINGNEDGAGGKYSTRLVDLANATAVELVGRHVVYLQSPDEFVQTILDF